MKTEIIKVKKGSPSKKSSAENEPIDSTRLLFTNGPKVPGAFTGINYQKMKIDKKKKPGKSAT